jgi:hypothetical protein
MSNMNEDRKLVRLGPADHRYGPWLIYYEPPPIPIRTCDWHFVHVDFDGAPDGHDRRCGSAPSVEDALAQIEEIEEMLADEAGGPDPGDLIDHAKDEIEAREGW